MQQELAGTTIRILGINQPTAVTGNVQICEGRDIPWLQEDLQSNVQAEWGAEHFDVVILDADNMPVAVYNLATHDLGNPDNYDELKALLQSY